MAFRPATLEQKYVFEYDFGIWSFGSVQVLRDRKSGELRTCKTCPRSAVRLDAASRLLQLRELRHHHVCTLVDVVEDQSRLYIISEKTLGGDVADWAMQVHEQGNWLQEHTVAAYVRHALIALAHSHSHGVTHRDLRPSSFALTSKLPDAEVKLCDLGVFEILDPTDAELRRNPSDFVAPEVISGAGQPVIGAADVWSVGAIAHSLLTGRPPSREEGSWSLGSLGASLLSARSSDDGWSGRSSMAKDFVRWLLQQAPGRPTAAKALQHPWLKGTVGPAAYIGDMAAVAERETRNRLLCYVLTVLLLPDLVQFRDFHQLRVAFTQADSDQDGFLARRMAQRLLVDLGADPESVRAALAVADVRKTDAFDLCATACAGLLAREFPADAAKADADGRCRLDAEELVPQLLQRFFQSYGDPKRRLITAKGVCTKMCTATMREVELHAGVSYEEVLLGLPEEGTIDADRLLEELVEGGGRGTPLAVDDSAELMEPDNVWIEALGTGAENVGKMVTTVIHSCGLGPKKPYRRQIAHP